MALTKVDDRGLKTPIDLLDNEKIRLGTGNDLELYHDGSHSYIKDTGTGNLVLATSELSVNNAASDEEMIKATQNGGVELFYDNSTKFVTSSTGVSVTGGIVGSKDAGVWPPVISFESSSRVYPRANLAATLAIGNPVAFEANAEDLETLGFISIILLSPFSGFIAN